MRTTRKQVESIFERFVKEIGGRVATAYDDHGTYRLDYNPTYGGYSIERISDTGTGVSMPFGMSRKSASEMWGALRFALDTIELMKKQGAAS